MKENEAYLNEGRPEEWIRESGEKVWWLTGGNEDGAIYFSFDKKRRYNVYGDYDKLTPEEKTIFDKENPFWANWHKGKS